MGLNIGTTKYGAEHQYKAYDVEIETKLFKEGKYWELISNVSPWIKKVCYRYVQDDTLTDLHQATLLYVHERIKQFDPSRGRLSTWSTWQVRNYAPRWLLAQKIIYSPLRPRFHVPKQELTEELASISETIDDCLDRRVIFNNLHLLNEREQIILDGLLEGKTYREIGKPLGITRERIRQIRDLIIRKFRSVIT